MLKYETSKLMTQKQKSKMVIVRLMGGLGNQMFQYAAALAYAAEIGAEVRVDVSLLGIESGGDTMRSFELSDLFLGPFNRASYWEYSRLYPHSSAVAHRLMHRVLRGHGRLFIQKGHEPIRFEREQCEYVGIVGRFQSEGYFSAHEGLIRDCFRFRHEVPQDDELVQLAKDPRTVGVHVRRGDYVSHPEYKLTLGFVGEEYLTNAMLRAHQELGFPPQFVVVSDDPDWCEEFFNQDAVVVRHSMIANPAHSDFMLLTLFKNLIISNSTFAWWAAKLSEPHSDLIIAPRRWAQAGWFDSEVIPSSWISI